MVSTDGENPVYGIKLSSVVPAEMTGNNRVHELSSMDLVMKLHYLRGVYFFNSKAVQGLKIIDFKNPMFKWLELHSASSGRVRRSESGRPFIRCNDSGVRIIEAQCNKTLEEWQEMKDCNLHNHLVSNQVLGPDLAFSPLILLQGAVTSAPTNDFHFLRGGTYHFLALMYPPPDKVMRGALDN